MGVFLLTCLLAVTPAFHAGVLRAVQTKGAVRAALRAADQADSFDALIGGRITDPTGAPVPHAQVMIKPLNGAPARYVLAGTDGNFQFHAPQGAYRVGARAEGFRPSENEIELRAGQEITFNLLLPLGSCSLCVTVPGQAAVSACVSDSAGLPVPGATVRLQGVGTAHASSYSLSALDDWGCGSVSVAEGRYTATAMAPGFQAEHRRMAAKEGADRWTFKLEPAR